MHSFQKLRGLPRKICSYQYQPKFMVASFKTLQNYCRMWANAQRDGHPAEYRWRPVFNAAKFG